MSRIEQAACAANPGFQWKAAIPALGLALALAGCSQAPAAQGDTGGSLARADNAKPVLMPSTCSSPNYPKDARRRGSQGTTTVRFLIDTDGTVARSDIQQSSGDASLDEAARVAMAKCRFTPIVKDGQPRRAWVPVQYVWSLAPARAPGPAPQAAPATPAAQSWNRHSR